MCRFTLYLGPRLPIEALVTKPTNSLIHQSFHSQEREEPMNGDGFGLAWYVPEVSPHPGVFRSLSPAWSNRNLLQLARVTSSECILAHVRAASDSSSVSEANCHPFTAGRLTFMHNGEVAAFRTIRREVLNGLSDPAFQVILGTTDSEHLFAMFLDRMKRSLAEDSAGGMANALEATFHDVLALARKHGVHEPSYLNIAVTDGRCAVVSRVTDGPPEDAESLYYHAGKRYECEDGVCRMVAPGAEGGSVLVSSERLSDDPGWQPVPVNHLVLVRGDRSVDVRPLARPLPAATTPTTRRLPAKVGVFPATRRIARA